MFQPFGRLRVNAVKREGPIPGGMGLVSIGSKFHELQASKFSFPAWGGELPGGGNTDSVVVAAVIQEAVDTEAVGAEEAIEDPAAASSLRMAIHSDVTLSSLGRL